MYGSYTRAVIGYTDKPKIFSHDAGADVDTYTSYVQMLSDRNIPGKTLQYSRKNHYNC